MRSDNLKGRVIMLLVHDHYGVRASITFLIDLGIFG